MKKVLYLVLDGGGDARVTKRPPSLRTDETAFRLNIDMPAPRRISGDIDVLLDERIVEVDGISMIPLKMTYQLDDDADEGES